jgi:hypothetical protein
VIALLAAGIVHAHSASDAYLTLATAAPQAAATVIEAQWDIALRDLHFAIGLDDDGDGNLTWAEVKKHAPRIARYAYESLRVSGDGAACAIEPSRQAIADRADGAYAALFFRVVCKGAPHSVAVDYKLFFAIDPSHRGILVFRSGGGTSTSLVSPENSHVELALPARK